VATQLERVQAFADAAHAVGSLGDLDLMMQEATEDLGADYYLMIHHTNFAAGGAGLVRMGSYPDEFVQISRQDGHPLDDPIMEACEKTLTGFFWDGVGEVIELHERHVRRMESVQETGLGDGYVVPAHIPGEHLGSCHFAVETGKTVPRENSLALHGIAIFGFEAARRLSKLRDEIWVKPPSLTPRQRECLILSARGKSDAVIGQLLDLSPRTVNGYMEDAKRRYGVATRGQLVVSALYGSEITFLDIVDLPRRQSGRGVGN
jgi:LuxR family transcriptional regulator, quorum-sensing system regulator CciR